MSALAGLRDPRGRRTGVRERHVSTIDWLASRRCFRIRHRTRHRAENGEESYMSFALAQFMGRCERFVRRGVEGHASSETATDRNCPCRKRRHNLDCDERSGCRAGCQVPAAARKFRRMEMDAKLIDRLFDLADSYSVHDPVGATLIRRAAKYLDQGRCCNCMSQYQHGYSNGYAAGYKRGSEEWQEEPSVARDRGF